ncbi:GMC family oxidoreductase N-terminal domain-containing protein [Myxococcota bacterium]|nr:GMC family oxidoreductase N-terminal domain-containing protein [Myxococcota bacterium]
MSHYDTIIAGAGSAGCVLAARASQNPNRRVVLLEAGPDYTRANLPAPLRDLGMEIEWPHEWGEKVRSRDGRLLPYLRGRGVGGSSSTNGGVAIRPGPDDFEHWPQGWGWNELLPCFRRLEHDLDFPDAAWHGDRGPIPVTRWPTEKWSPFQATFVDACLALGLPACEDHNEPYTTGVGPIPMNRDGRRRISSALAYLEPARPRANLEVRGDANVQRLTFQGNRVTGVELLNGETLHADQVIVASGVLQSPRILWRSGIGPADLLRKRGVKPLSDLLGVGQGWSDHFVLSYGIEIAPEAFPPGSQSLQTIVRTTAPDSTHTNDLNLTPWAQRTPKGANELVVSISLQVPEGTASTRPGDDDGKSHPDWPFGSVSSNISRLREAWRLTAKILERSGLAVDPSGLHDPLHASDHQLDEHIEYNHTAFYHGVGTCRIGDDEASVVDLHTAIRGVEGAHVVDASIAPMVPRTNTNLLVIALAERAADLLWTD